MLFKTNNENYIKINYKKKTRKMINITQFSKTMNLKKKKKLLNQ